jgi:hypothetical protein
MSVPKGYFHKATNESFNGSTKVSIYYNRLLDDYLIEIGGVIDDLHELVVTKQELELIVQAGKDVLDDLR